MMMMLLSTTVYASCRVLMLRLKKMARKGVLKI